MKHFGKLSRNLNEMLKSETQQETGIARYYWIMMFDILQTRLYTNNKAK